MVTVLSPFSELEPEEFRRVTEVTYLGVVWGTISALKRMRRINKGTIVQVGSALAYRPIPLQSAYCGSKHAIRGFTDSIRTELLHENSKVHLTTVHLPAVNTPQFSWGRTKLSNQPQPVPPIYQPEVPADGIYWAATHRRREVLVGFNTVYIIQGNKLVPDLVDRYLARNAYEAQKTDELLPEDREDNLFTPLSGDFGTHGIFDHTAKDRSRQLWFTKNRGWILPVFLLVLIILLILFL